MGVEDIEEWSESPQPKITQPSFLRTDLGEDEVSHRFERGYPPIIIVEKFLKYNNFYII